MSQKIKYHHLFGTLISCLFLMFGLHQPVEAQTANIQQAVFRDYQMKFSYDANRYVIYHTSENEISINLREDVLDLPTGFNPAMSIRVVSGASDMTTALQTYLQSRSYSGDITLQSDTVISNLPAKQVIAAGWHTEVEIGMVSANNNIYIIEAAPDFANAQLPEAAAAAKLMWDMIVGSIDFAPAELNQEIAEDCINDSAFVRDITIPDGTQVTLAIPFTKSWELLNDGTCPWFSDYRLKLIGFTPNWEITRWSQLAPVVPYTEPNQSAEIAISLALSTEATSAVSHQAQYQLADGDGQLFGTKPYVEVVPILDSQPIIEQPSSGVTSFSSSNFGITFTYPDNWVYTQLSPDVVSLSSYDIPAQIDDNFTIPDGEMIIEVINLGAGTVAEIASSTNYIVLPMPSGLPAIRVESLNPEDSQETLLSYYVEANGTLYEFQVFGDTTQADAIVSSTAIAQ